MQWRVDCSSQGASNADEGGVGDAAKCLQIDRAGHVSTVYQVLHRAIAQAVWEKWSGDPGRVFASTLIDVYRGPSIVT